ncbi:hypothetical protein PR048_022333 [Dryococelus australis]|uniref:Phosphatidylinositol N-acetylglucosaminyltransferase subunit C n=1 Tax=Dryococelus australis TaxID=614101 RepID=A0ABQ9H0P3_9NEOP|nr:hypothetical protein PR048_022333 [Dryococelus australis]
MANKKHKAKKQPQPVKVTWKKNLYENVGFPDNYTDVTFLKNLRRNVNKVEVTFLSAVCGAGLVTQEICSVILFVIVFVYLHCDWTQPETVFMASSIVTCIGYCAYRQVLARKQTCIEVYMQDAKTVVIFLVFGYILSPILKTLTDTISTDTIYAMAAFMMSVHVVFFDYGVSVAVVSGCLSLNAALFAAVCLVSRLASSFHAFVLLTCAVESFALLPLLLAQWRGSMTVLVAMITMTVLSLSTVSATITVVFVCAALFITVACPLWFLQWQKYKDNIYGPWDEAVIDDTHWE